MQLLTLENSSFNAQMQGSEPVPHFHVDGETRAYITRGFGKRKFFASENFSIQFLHKIIRPRTPTSLKALSSFP